jgi:hypothetical protein
MVSNSLVSLFLNPMWMIFGCPLVTQQWYQSQWVGEGFHWLLVPKVFLTKVVRRHVLLNSNNCGTNVWMKKLPLMGEHNVLNDSYLRGRLLWQVWGELSLILFRNVEVEHFINKMTYKPNVLRFLSKNIMSNSLIYSYSDPNMNISTAPLTHNIS